MRKAVFIAAVLACFNLRAQSNHLVISFNRLSVLHHPGNVDYTRALNSDGFSESSDSYRKEYDFEKRTVRCFKNGEEYSTVKIDSFTFDLQKGYVIYFTEKDLRNEQHIQTMQVIDITAKKGYYTWYWDGEEDATFVEVEELTEIQSSDQ
jgi:hypothetical protein